MRFAPGMRLLPVAALAVLAPGGAHAATRFAEPGTTVAALAVATAGDTVVLGAGVHRGPLTIAAPITLRGAPGAIVAGGGRGKVLVIEAPGAVVEDLTITGSGARVLTVDCGVHVFRAADVTLRRLRLRDVLYGIYGERSDRLTVEDCSLTGRVRPGDELGGGNGLHLWYSAGAVMRRDTVSRFLDGVYLSFANGAHVERCVLEDAGRYGLHTMYCQGGRLTASRFRRNVAGCAIMFSNRLRLEGNEFMHNRGPRTYGVLLRDCSDGVFVANRFVDNTIAMFLDNSNRNQVRANLIQDNGWGVLLFSSCAGNTFAGNAFINDDVPVALDMRRTSNRFDGGSRGNYWSESAPYDLDGDGVSDAPHGPVSTFAFVSKQVPDLAILAKSPAVAALGVAERVLPALRPSEAVDRFPLVSPPALTVVSDGRAEDRARRDWAAAAGFAAFAGLALLGLALGRGAA